MIGSSYLRLPAIWSLSAFRRRRLKQSRAQLALPTRGMGTGSKSEAFLACLHRDGLYQLLDHEVIKYGHHEGDHYEFIYPYGQYP